MTIKELTYDIKNTLYSGQISRDNRLPDRLLEQWINNYRAVLLKRDTQKGRTINPDIIQDLGCLEVECLPLSECCSMVIGKNHNVHRTKPLPKTIELNQINTITYVGLTDKLTEFEYTPIHTAVYGLSSKWTKTKPLAFLLNNRIHITNLDDIEVINVRGVFENPRDVANFVDCKSSVDGTVGDCVDDFEYPISATMWPMVKDYILRTDLAIFATSIKDFLNNSLDESGFKSPKSGINDTADTRRRR